MLCIRHQINSVCMRIRCLRERITDMYGKIKNATNEGVSVKLEGVSLPCNVSSQLKLLELAFYDNYLTDLHTNTVNNLRFTYPPRWRLEP